jgi:Tol biopolymer transport system component
MRRALRLIRLSLAALLLSSAAAWGADARVTTLKEGGARLDWLGGRIAFDMLGPGDFFAVYVMRADGGEVRCLSCGHPDLPGRHTGQPAWHPSGRYLVIQAEKRTHRKVRFESVLWPGAGVLNDLWLLDLETNRATLLREVEDAPGRGTLHAHFSADGRRLSWGEMQEAGSVRKGSEFGFWALMTADFATDGPAPRLENVRAYTPGGRAFYENHGFSPDGSRLIFTSTFEAQKRLEAHIYTLELASQRLARLTTEGYNEHAHYSPDGRSIAWMSTHGIQGRGTDYWIMDSDGANKRRLTYFNQRGHPHHSGEHAVVADLSWRPDGRAFGGFTSKPGAFALRRPSRIILVELP